MKTAADADVTLPRKVCAPRPPKTACELPPKAPPRPLPFPAWSRMTTTRTAETTTWTTMRKVFNGWLPG